MPVYVSLQNPYVWHSDDGMRSSTTVNAEARADGHDGIIREWADGTREIVAFKPTQVKSAIGNNGDFDGDNPDIRFSRSVGDTLTSAANSARDVNLPAGYKVGDHHDKYWRATLASTGGTFGKSASA